MKFTIAWTYFSIIVYYFSFGVECHKGNLTIPINVRAAYSPQTGNITVTWEDRPGSQPSGYRLWYFVNSTNRKYEDLSTNSFAFTPKVLGATYKINLMAYRINSVRSPKADGFVTTPRPQYNAEGTTASIYFTVQDGIWDVWHGVNRILVMHDDSITVNNLKKSTKISSDSRQIIITFNDVSVREAGVYTTRKNSVDINSTILVITEKPSPPKISTRSASVVGRSVTLLCSSKSNSVPAFHGLALSYSWTINNTVVQSDAKYSVNNDELKILKLNLGDRYNYYMCTVTENDGLTSNSAVYTLDLTYGPQSVTLSSDKNVTVAGGDVIAPITCHADCNPMCNLVWQRQARSGYTDVGSGAVLNLGSATEGDEGGYRCAAVGDTIVPSALRRRQSNVVYISVKYAPGVSVDLSPIHISDSNVVLTWISPYNGGFDQTFTIEQRQTQEKQKWQITATDIVDSGEKRLHFYVVKNLKPDTSYQFKLYSRNAIGPSDETKITITTKVSWCPNVNKRGHITGLTAGLCVSVVIGFLALVWNVILMLKFKSRICGNVKARTKDPIHQYENVDMTLSAVASNSDVDSALHYESLKRRDIEEPGVYDVICGGAKQRPSTANKS